MYLQKRETFEITFKRWRPTFTVTLNVLNEKQKQWKNKLLAYISHHLGSSSFYLRIFHLRLLDSFLCISVLRAFICSLHLDELNPWLLCNESDYRKISIHYTSSPCYFKNQFTIIYWLYQSNWKKQTLWSF